MTGRLDQDSQMAVAVPSTSNGGLLSQAETPRVPLSARSEGGTRLDGGVTQVHAAAVNGDRQTLARLLAMTVALEELDVGDQFGRSPLMYCVLADRPECAEILIKAGAQINLKDKGGRTALHWAAHKGNLRLMKLLLTRGADCREKDNEGQTALHLCTRHKLPKVMALLLRQLTPGEIDDQDKNKRTALHWAASHGNLEHVKMLIKQNSNIGIPDTEGKTPLHWAASSQDREALSCVKLVLETTPSVINWQDYEGRTALHLAVADGNESVVHVLTSVKDVNVSALDNMFRTPLHWAAVLGHSKIVSILLDSGADSASSDANGATPLHYAAQNNYSETVSVFLRRHLTDEPDLEGRTAFMWAAGTGADDVLQAFLSASVDIQQDDKTGGTALHAAALSGHSSTVKLLLDRGARLEVTDQAKHTPLFRACEMGHMDVVQTLVDYGARVDGLDQDGRSPLHWAALGGHAYICQMLIKYGDGPNIRDHSARAPLHCAAYGGFVNCMSALMEHGAEPNSQDREGMTCLHWACSKGHLDAVKLLIEYNAFPNHMEFTEDRYTPLDYGLMGEHHEVAQYMIEQGALSITGIQDIAAQKIQCAFRGYRVRKAFIERKKLLMKHEKLKKEAARKRAAEECKKAIDDKKAGQSNTVGTDPLQSKSEASDTNQDAECIEQSVQQHDQQHHQPQQQQEEEQPLSQQHNAGCEQKTNTVDDSSGVLAEAAVRDKQGLQDVQEGDSRTKQTQLEDENQTEHQRYHHSQQPLSNLETKDHEGQQQVDQQQQQQQLQQQQQQQQQGEHVQEKQREEFRKGRQRVRKSEERRRRVLDHVPTTEDDQLHLQQQQQQLQPQQQNMQKQEYQQDQQESNPPKQHSQDTLQQQEQQQAQHQQSRFLQKQQGQPSLKHGLGLNTSSSTDHQKSERSSQNPTDKTTPRDSEPCQHHPQQQELVEKTPTETKHPSKKHRSRSRRRRPSPNAELVPETPPTAREDSEKHQNSSSLARAKPSAQEEKEGDGCQSLPSTGPDRDGEAQSVRDHLYCQPSSEHTEQGRREKTHLPPLVSQVSSVETTQLCSKSDNYSVLPIPCTVKLDDSNLAPFPSSSSPHRHRHGEGQLEAEKSANACAGEKTQEPASPTGRDRRKKHRHSRKHHKHSEGAGSSKDGTLERSGGDGKGKEKVEVNEETHTNHSHDDKHPNRHRPEIEEGRTDYEAQKQENNQQLVEQCEQDKQVTPRQQEGNEETSQEQIRKQELSKRYQGERMHSSHKNQQREAVKSCATPSPDASLETRQVSAAVVKAYAVDTSSGRRKPPEPDERERILAGKSQTHSITLTERKRREDFQKKVEAAHVIQKAWRRHNRSKSSKRRTAIFQDCTKVSVHKKRLRATQEEWEKQIAALTIQLAWRKFFRRKLLRTLHPNRRQLLMWDPEIVALKQQALVHYIYNEHIEAPFWHPTLRPAIRPLWTRFIPSAAAVSYNFAVDQYYPWVARAGAIPEFPPGHEAMMPSPASPHPASVEGGEQQQHRSGGGSGSGKGSRPGSDRGSERSSHHQKSATGQKSKSARFSYNMRRK